MQKSLAAIIVAFLIFLTACSTPKVEFGTPTEIPQQASLTSVPTATPPVETPQLEKTAGIASTSSPSPTSTAVADFSVQAFPDPDQFTWQPVINGLDRPVFMTHAGDGSGRLFIVEQAGRILILQNGELQQTPFLDIRFEVGSQSNEQGLLGLAFHPRYSENGYFYVNYTDRNGDTVIARFQVNAGDPNQSDPASELRLLQIPQPYPNHNGGATVFGPDGYLYLGLGDGGSGGDPLGNGQSIDTLLGKILRLDVDQSDTYGIPPENQFAGGQRPEIWAYGLRNPWRFSFDRLTGDIYTADVGQNQWEEINYLPANSPAGANFGWNYYEASHLYTDTQPPPGMQFIQPVVEYSHNPGCSVTGGYVYRGKMLPEWNGIYLFGDYCSGEVRGAYQDNSGTWQQKILFETNALISSFGEDEQGEIYLVDLAGSIFRLSRNPLSLGNIPHYSIHVDIDYDQRKFNGSESIAYTNNEKDTLDRLIFRLLPNGHETYGSGSLTVNQVRLNGAIIAPLLSGQDTILEVPLPTPLEPGELVTLDLDFSGQVSDDFGGAQNPNGYGIYNYSDGVLALASWYPQLAVYDDQGWHVELPSMIGDSVFSDIASYDVTISLPEDVVPVTTGRMVQHQVENGQARWTFESDPARDFFMVMSPDYQATSKEKDGIRVNSYYLPEHKTAGLQVMNLAERALTFYNTNFGAYPYSELDLVEAPLRGASGVEYPGIILLGRANYAQEQPDLSVVTSHEIAHQWWYNTVGNNVFTDPWLDEGLATYSTYLFFEHAFGEQAAQSLVEYWNKFAREGDNGRITGSLEYFETQNDQNLYAASVYLKSALFFHSLRHEIGETAFLQALQTYYNQYSFQIASVDGLLKIFEDSSGQDLDVLYQRWLGQVE